ncbi:unnamed protein product [Acanthoscelides obtectus]|uniref:DUF1308 domain-containing protein n=1 Tax=Acanthoscelides obtectus TaxID=200917 RepID=A0A9P0Q8L2_ACAOB|nr:unnamed protein product [Acanthoscelides obtectus]CAK1630767.1 hypothetical protein AOBTE_LOCUS6545 [Acanthoscelides obtectus]
MSTQHNCEDLTDIAPKKIKFGEDLLKTLEKHKQIEGSQKLVKKIGQELKFLKKTYKSNAIKKEHLQCSNLTHFSALINILNTVQNCQSVTKVFMLEDRKITVDIVSDGGLTWTKVIARNPKSVSQICMGNASYGVKSIIDQAGEYVECAKLYPCLFQTPKIVFVFTNGINSQIASKLENIGITVRGERICDQMVLSSSESDASDYEHDNIDRKVSNVADLSTKDISNISKINLDVSAMLAYCSSVTNGSAVLYDFNVPVLKQQAEWERLRPQKPILDGFFKGKTLYCCQTAIDNFINIVDTVGGPNERKRAKDLIDRLTVLPDNANCKMTSENDNHQELFNKVQYTEQKALDIGGKIKQRSLTIFTFGDRIQAVTVTANDGFVRSAKQQGINFVVYIHESRALTEQKEMAKAIPLNSNKT